MNGDKQDMIVDSEINGKRRYSVQILRETDNGLVCVKWCNWVDSCEEAAAQIEMMIGADETE